MKDSRAEFHFLLPHLPVYGKTLSLDLIYIFPYKVALKVRKTQKEQEPAVLGSLFKESA